MSFLVIDAVVMLCFDGALWQWLVLSGIEVGAADRHALAQQQRRADGAGAAGNAGRCSGESEGFLSGCRRSCASWPWKLERVDAQTLTRHLSVTGGKELSALGESINAMLEAH